MKVYLFVVPSYNKNYLPDDFVSIKLREVLFFKGNIRYHLRNFVKPKDMKISHYVLQKLQILNELSRIF